MHIRYSGERRRYAHSVQAHGSDGALRPTFRANNTLSLLAAIEAGAGIGGAQRPLIAEQLATGHWCRFAGIPLPPMALHAVYPALTDLFRRKCAPGWRICSKR